MQGLLAWFDVHARRFMADRESVTLGIATCRNHPSANTNGNRIPYWERIRTAYPNPSALAKDSEENLLHLWQGCGYYACEKPVQIGQNSRWETLPKTPDELQKLPGIGPTQQLQSHQYVIINQSLV